MKLIKFQNRNEGDDYPDDYLFVVGCQIENKHFNGLYIVFNSPIKHNAKYITEYDFVEKYGLCVNRYLFMIRKCVNNRIYPLFIKCNKPV